MVPGVIAAAVRCLPTVKRRLMVAPPRPWRGTMQQAAALLAPRPRIVRRAVGWGCPAAVLPSLIPPVIPGLPPPVPPSVPPATTLPLPPLPFEIGNGPLLGRFTVETVSPPPVLDAPGPVAGVPEPASLAVLAVAIAMLACLLLWRRAA